MAVKRGVELVPLVRRDGGGRDQVPRLNLSPAPARNGGSLATGISKGARKRSIHAMARNAREAQSLCRCSYCVVEWVFGPYLAVEEGAQLGVEAEAELAPQPGMELGKQGHRVANG